MAPVPVQIFWIWFVTGRRGSTEVCCRIIATAERGVVLNNKQSCNDFAPLWQVLTRKLPLLALELSGSHSMQALIWNMPCPFIHSFIHHMHIHVVVYQVLFTHWVKFKPKSYAAQICSISPTQDNLGSRKFYLGQGESQELQTKSFFLAICAIANALWWLLTD